MRYILCVLLIATAVVDGFPSAQATDGAVWFPPVDRTPRIESKLQPCGCQKFSCGCCFLVNLPDLHFKDTGCVNLTYLPSHIGIDLKLSLNGTVIFEQEVSMSNPPPLCVNIPHLKTLAKICVRLYNLSIHSHAVQGCAAIEVKVAYLIHERIPLGCFRIPFLEDRPLTFAPTNDLAAQGKMLLQDWDAFLQLLRRQEGGEELLVMEHLLRGFHQVLKEANGKRALKNGA